MLYEVVFLTKGACDSKSKEIEVVTLNGGEVNGRLFEGVQRIIKRREKVHPTVDKWATMSACELKRKQLGLTVVVYKAARHPYTQKVARCRAVYQNKS